MNFDKRLKDIEKDIEVARRLESVTDIKKAGVTIYEELHTLRKEVTARGNGTMTERQRLEFIRVIRMLLWDIFGIPTDDQNRIPPPEEPDEVIAVEKHSKRVIDCTCQQESIVLDSWPEDKEIYLSIWEYKQRHKIGNFRWIGERVWHRFVQGLRCGWQTFRTGDPFLDQIVLTQEDAKRLASDLEFMVLQQEGSR